MAIFFVLISRTSFSVLQGAHFSLRLELEKAMDPIAIASSALNLIQSAKKGVDEAELVNDEAKELLQEINMFELTIGMIPRRGPAGSEGAASPSDAVEGAAEEKTGVDDSSKSDGSLVHQERRLLKDATSDENVEAGKTYIKDLAKSAAFDAATNFAESKGVPVTAILNIKDYIKDQTEATGGKVGNGVARTDLASCWRSK